MSIFVVCELWSVNVEVFFIFLHPKQIGKVFFILLDMKFKFLMRFSLNIFAKIFV